MRILHVIQELNVGGAERAVIALVHGARRAGHDVAVLAAGGALATGVGDVPLYDLPLVRRRVHRLPAAVWAVRRALRAWSPDLLHCHNIATAVAVALAGGWRRRALVTLEGFVREEDARWNARILRLLRMPAVACGPGVAAALRDYRVHVPVIANGVSPPPPPLDRQRLDRDWPALRGRRLLVAVGRLVPVKNFALAVRAVARVPDAALLLVGDGPERAALERTAAAEQVTDRVVFAGMRGDAREIIGAADACLVTSHLEGLSLAALDMLAAGRPLIATRARWLDGVLTHERDSLVVERDDVGAVVAAVRRVLDDPALALRLGDAARGRATAYSEAAALTAYLDLYRDLVSPDGIA